ncbi:hypothetical protein Sipo8835_29230 [Streptomyces ipomoeae]|uniref:Uncharacterized protein n=1 Tax=Streptomyces ipomoeae TaxID=103232 RepID=A0AAE8VY23_9ACTN|nr:hypothetical protein [Streptomyces ipomoeae]TQE26412.1 hypothetical protein Sipo8835_29230 [Streptomyces ipomoeae]
MGIVISLDDYRRRKGLLPRISTTATTAGKRQCAEADCGRTVHAKGLCSRCYSRQYQARKLREQQPTTATRPTAPARSRRAARSAIVVTDVDPWAVVREALVMPERRPAARREAVSV